MCISYLVLKEFARLDLECLFYKWEEVVLEGEYHGGKDFFVEVKVFLKEEMRDQRDDLIFRKPCDILTYRSIATESIIPVLKNA